MDDEMDDEMGGTAGYEDEDYFGGARRKRKTKKMKSRKTGKTKKGRITPARARHTVRATKAMRLYHSGKAKSLCAAWAILKRSGK
jgi:hypothetical protein